MTLVALEAQQPAPAKKTIFILGATKGWQHDSISDAMATIRNMGKESGLYDSYIRTDYTWLTKGPTGANGKNLTKFDALVFVSTTGEMDLTDAQKKDAVLVHDEGKGFVGVHAARTPLPLAGIRRYIAGVRRAPGHVDAPIVREDATFPATALPGELVKRRDLPG